MRGVTEVKAMVAEVGRRFHAGGYLFFLTGETSRLWYRHRPSPVLRGWTNADLLWVAGHFEEADYAPAGDWSVAVPVAGRRLELACDPLFQAHPARVRTADFEPVAARQAFTVHALLHEPVRDRFLDPLDIRADVRSDRLRRVPGTPWPLRERPARLFEAVWLECHEGLDPDPDLLADLAAALPAVEREDLPAIREGLERVLTCRHPFEGLVRLDHLGVLGRIIPEIDMLKGCPQDKEFHPEGDVFTHTLECFRRRRNLPLAVALGLLLHDIGKPSTLTMGKTLHYPGHSTVGAAVARSILRRLGFPRETIEEVQFYVRNHLLWRVLRGLNDDEVAVLVRHPWFENLLRVYRADIQGSSGDLSNYRHILRRLAPFRPAPSRDDD
jgi:tRNA nucleotidyltransferase/poly(A) polymerase